MEQSDRHKPTEGDRQHPLEAIEYNIYSIVAQGTIIGDTGSTGVKEKGQNLIHPKHLKTSCRCCVRDQVFLKNLKKMHKYDKR